jgi:hypothetical protein
MLFLPKGISFEFVGFPAGNARRYIFHRFFMWRHDMDGRTDIKYTGYDLLSSNIEYARKQFVNNT